MFSQILIIVLLFFSGTNADENSVPEGCFRAAVLDHVHQSSVEKNLEVYEKATELAKGNGADIIVFPEDGLSSFFISRHSADKFAEEIPNVNVSYCTKEHHLINRLSCLAQKHQIFLAVNLVERKPCDQNKVSKCPRDKKFLFNTAVLFDRQGKVIGKYHKMHLYGEFTMNPPPEPEFIIIDTELGRLGMQICFDMIFKTPGHLLAKENKIDTMLFPTFWFDEVPFLAAGQYQMAWAFGNNISLLASNIHKVSGASRGSGVYIGPQREFVSALFDDSIERVVLANVPKRARSNMKCPLNAKFIEVPQENKNEKVKYRHKNMDLANTKMTELKPFENSAKLCHNGLCCHIEYQMTHSELSTKSYLLVANRTRPSGAEWTEEFCSLVHRYEDSTPNRFSYAKLTGEFSQGTTVYPSSIGDEHQLIHPENKWTFWVEVDNKVTIEFGSKQSQENLIEPTADPLGTLALYGRAYARDPIKFDQGIKPEGLIASIIKDFFNY